jgi:hypothetical protein
MLDCDWSSDVCSSDLGETVPVGLHLDHACWFAADGEGARL